MQVCALFTADNNTAPRRYLTTHKIRGTASQQLHKIGEAAEGAIDNAFAFRAAGEALPTVTLDVASYARHSPPLLDPATLQQERLLLPYMARGAKSSGVPQCASDHTPLIFSVEIPAEKGSVG